MAPKPKKSQPAPPSIQGVDWNSSLADFKQATVSSVKPGGTKMPTPNKPADTGMFAGSSTPLGTSLAGSKLSKGNIASTTVSAIMLGGGAGPIPGIASKVTSAVNTKASSLGVSAGVDYLGGAMNKIGSTLPSVGGQIKQTAGTIYSQFGATPGKEAFIQMPFRTPNQVAGTIKGMVTKESNVASKIANYSATTAKQGIKTGAKYGAAAAGTAGTAIGYLLGKNKKDK
jgi:hypothetical protein